jgi:hypothetical protein
MTFPVSLQLAQLVLMALLVLGLDRMRGSMEKLVTVAHTLTGSVQEATRTLSGLIGKVDVLWRHFLRSRG